MARRRPGRVATAMGGYGNVPGYGSVRNPPGQKPSAPKPVGFSATRPAGQGSGGQGSRPLPVDAAYDQQIGALQKQRDDALAAIPNAQTRALADYGYSGTFDASGSLTGLSFDPNNPFSRAALALKTHQRSKAGTENSMAGRGQLYSGALSRLQTENDLNYQQNENQLQRGLGDVLAGLADRRRQAQSDYEFGAGQAYGERVSRASQSPLYEPTPSTDSSAAPAARAKPKPGFQFVQDSGPNKGLSYKIVKKNGKNFRRFEDGRDVPQ